MVKYTYDNKTKKYISADWQVMWGWTAYKLDDWTWSLTKPKSTTSTSSTSNKSSSSTSNKNTWTSNKSTSTSNKNNSTSNVTKLTGKWDFASDTAASWNKTYKTEDSKTASREITDMSTDKNWNIITTYSDWTKRVTDKKWNLISDSVTTPSWINANDIPNGSKAWDQWDYAADISKDVNRAKELLYNIKQYAEKNSQLFKNYEDFKKYFQYDARHPSQQKILDKAFENYNKYWLNSSENKIADDASQLAADKGNERIQNALDWYNKRAANLQSIYDTMNPKYQWLIDKYDTLYEKAFKELDDLKKLANEYYNHTKAMYDEQSAGEAAGVESRLSAQWLWYTAIGSSTTWVGNQWAKRYNNLMKTHLETLMELQDKWATIQTTILNWMWDLTDKQAAIVKDYFTGLNDLWDAVEKEQQDAVNWIYAPYEAITWQKVTSAAEVAWTWAKVQSKNAQYQAMNSVEKRNMIVNNLITIFWEWVDLSSKWPYFNAVAQAVSDNPNDWQKALYQAVGRLQAAWVKTKKQSKWWDLKFEDWIAKNEWASYDDMKEAFPNMSEDELLEAFYW